MTNDHATLTRFGPRWDWALGAAVGVVHFAAYTVLGGKVGALYEDGADYSNLAADLSQHFSMGPTAFRPPGWPIVLAVPYRVFGVHPTVGLVLNAVLVGLTVVALIRLGQRLGLSQTQARIAAVGYGFFPWVVVMGASLYAETFFNFLTVVIATLFVKFRQIRPAPWQWAVLGLLCGYALMVRSAFGLWLPVAFLLALGRKWDWRAAVALTVGCTVIVGAWTWRNSERLDAFIPLTTAGGNTLAVANNDLAGSAQNASGVPKVGGGEVAADKANRKFAYDWIRRHPGEFAARVPQRIVRTFDPVTRLNKGVFAPPPLRWAARLLWLILVGFMAVGIARYHRGPWLVPLSLAVMLTLQVVLMGGGFRFLIPALPFLAFFCVAGATPLWNAMRAGRRSPTERLVEHSPSRGHGPDGSAPSPGARGLAKG